MKKILKIFLIVYFVTLITTSVFASDNMEVVIDDAKETFTLYGDGDACVHTININGVDLEIWYTTSVSIEESPYTCGELINRYCSSKYLTTVEYTDRGIPSASMGGIKFVETTEPEKGDIVCWTPRACYQYTFTEPHTAIIVNVESPTKVRIVEQNSPLELELHKMVSSELTRVIDIENKRYKIYHIVSE